MPEMTFDAIHKPKLEINTSDHLNEAKYEDKKEKSVKEKSVKEKSEKAKVIKI